MRKVITYGHAYHTELPAHDICSRCRDDGTADARLGPIGAVVQGEHFGHCDACQPADDAGCRMND